MGLIGLAANKPGAMPAPLITTLTLVGLALTALLAGSMRPFLFGVTPLDPLTFVGAAGVLALTAAAAAAVPSLRAVRVDPATAFRSE